MSRSTAAWRVLKLNLVCVERLCRQVQIFWSPTFNMGNSLQSNKVRPVDNDLLELEAAYAERSKWSRWCLPSLVQKEVPKRHQLRKRKRKRPSTNAETGSPPVRPKEGRQSKTIGRILSTLSFCLCFGVSVKTSNEVGPSAAAEAEECPSRGSAEGASHTACISRKETGNVFLAKAHFQSEQCRSTFYWVSLYFAQQFCLNRI